jgi:hypothetical protein
MSCRIAALASTGPLLLLAACATTPMSPSVAVMPAHGKPFDAFQYDQTLCKQFAESEVASGTQRANNQHVATAVVGTVLGAGLGASLGGGRGAAIGAGAGALGGSAAGAGMTARAQDSLQHRYDVAYSQCMYSRGNQVPVAHGGPGYGFAAPGYPYSSGYYR